VNTGDHSVSNVKLVLTAQDEFITKYHKTFYFVDVFYGNILVYDPNPATGAVENRRIFALAPRVG
jgi:hypothetical protein